MRYRFVQSLPGEFLLIKTTVRPRKINMDTQNDGLENASPFKYVINFGGLHYFESKSRLFKEGKHGHHDLFPSQLWGPYSYVSSHLQQVSEPKPHIKQQVMPTSCFTINSSKHIKSQRRSSPTATFFRSSWVQKRTGNPGKQTWNRTG